MSGRDQLLSHLDSHPDASEGGELAPDERGRAHRARVARSTGYMAGADPEAQRKEQQLARPQLDLGHQAHAGYGWHYPDYFGGEI